MAKLNLTSEFFVSGTYTRNACTEKSFATLSGPFSQSLSQIYAIHKLICSKSYQVRYQINGLNVKDHFET